MNLKELIVLFLDCQTTASNPKKGNVVEIAWACSSSSPGSDLDLSSVQTHILQQPLGVEIPERVYRITGIKPEEIFAGDEPARVWAQLIPQAAKIARLNSLEKCPLVIHYAKFELPFLIDLQDRYAATSGFPFKVLCTHVLAKRLFPELPRRSLRAMSGYFGHSLGQYRRSKEHVIATARIWEEMIGVLEKKYHITTFRRLQEWLDQPIQNCRREVVYPMASDERQGLPDKPGVYRMLRSNSDVLYVGKASSLKKRVTSYFRKSIQHPEHILEMLSQAKKLDVTVTGSVLEAAILESDEIKRLSPPYNVALRSGEREVWFCSSDLCEFNLEPSEKYKIGPLLSQDSVARLGLIRQLVLADTHAEVGEEELAAALGIPEEYTPDYDCARAGSVAFLARYRERLANGDKTLALKRFANGLWLERQAEKEAEVEETDELILQGEKVPMWTPETVCHLLESNIVRGFYELRRARWLVLLSEAALAWEEINGKRRSRYLVMFEKGQILYHIASEEEAMPVPTGHIRGFADRQRSFDLMTADRLRVITTEIRKAVAAGRWVRVCLRPNVVLDGNKLTRMFRWI
jgi:DNA polymerase-3 subunit epsilon